MHHFKPYRKTLLALCSILLAGSAHAEWIYLGRTDTFRIFLEQKQILRKDGLAQLWQLMDFTTAQWADAQTAVGSIKSRVEYDCEQPRFRTLVSEAYSEQMSAGRLVATEKMPDPRWEAVETGGPADQIRHLACGKEK